MNKILVLGGNGFIGSHLAAFFLQKGYEMHLILRRNSSRWRIQGILSQVNIHTGNINDNGLLDTIINAVKPEIIINATGIVRGESMDDQDNVIVSNLTSTVQVVNSFIRSRAEILLNTGTAKEYGFSPTAVKENYNGIPLGLYGVTRKAATEYSQFNAIKFERNIINMRLFTPYGTYDSLDRLIPHCVFSLIQGRRPKIRNNGGVRDFVYMYDVSAAYEQVIKNMDRLGNWSVINVGNGKPVTVNYVLNELLKIIPHDFAMDILEDTMNSDSMDVLYSNNERLVSLGWKGRFDLRAGLSATVEWFRNNLQCYDKIQKR